MGKAPGKGTITSQHTQQSLGMKGNLQLLAAGKVTDQGTREGGPGVGVGGEEEKEKKI